MNAQADLSLPYGPHARRYEGTFAYIAVQFKEAIIDSTVDSRYLEFQGTH